MRRDVKAFCAFFFGILWFAVVVLGITVLFFPQIIASAYGKDVDWIDSFCEAMESLFDKFKEL